MATMAISKPTRPDVNGNVDGLSPATDAIMTGRIKRIKAAEGYGFIVGDDGQDRFFYKSFLNDAKGIPFDERLERKRVEFVSSVHVDGRLRATDVWLLDE